MKAMYAGSFNPFHIGHNYVYQEACKIFDEVVLAIPRKHKGKNVDVEFLKWCLAPITKNVVIIEGLTCDSAKQYNCDYLIRGLRDSKDFEEESKIAEWNLELVNIQTIFIKSPTNSLKISSSAIHEIGKYRANLNMYFPNHYQYFRYGNGKIPKNNLYFGKMSVGKSTYLKRESKGKIGKWVKDLDKEIWQFFTEQESRDFKKKFKKYIACGDFSEYYKLIIKMSAKISWQELLDKNYSFEASALGMWFDFIPKSILSKFSLIKISTSASNRESFCNMRGLTKEVVTNFDSFYQDPPFYDELIMIGENYESRFK